MADSIYTELAKKRGNLLSKITENYDISSIAMGLLGRIIYICEQEKNIPVTGLTFGAWEQNSGATPNICTFSSHIQFNRISIARFHKWGPQREFAQYVGQKAAGMALALRDNPEMEAWLQSLIENIDKWCEYRNIPFQEIECFEHIITKNDVVVLRMKRASQIVAA